ncbi:MAG TPA: LD-carboxypeptidase [Thermoanaerobaculia bacterium]|nr:LD-carboxypeptidase [Thermoanaerobaculia bacterium]
MSAARRFSSPRKPRAVLPGDIVGVAALSSAVSRQAVDAGVRRLEEYGFRVRAATNLGEEWQGFAGRDQARLAGFHELVAAPEVKAIIFARGGHGVLRILPAIDWELLASSPKAYVGYSDVVPLLLQIVTRLRLVCFHGPMVATDLAVPLGADERRSLLDALAGKLEREIPCECASGVRTMVGPLLGGCLAMLVSTLGTPWFPCLDGSLLFLEDTNEPLYRIDRMLTQLELSGRVRRVKGMILGHLGEAERVAGGACAGDLGGEDGARVWRRLTEQPIGGEARRIMAWNLPCGHGRPNLTLPLGATARLDADTGTLVVDDVPEV